MSLSLVPEYAFLANGGEVGALLRAHDWSRSPLGCPGTWPQSLRTIVGMMLNSKFPMFVAWGPELGLLYNDAYAEIMGAKHPNGLGQRFEDVWSEIWVDLLPIIEQALQGHAVYYEDLPFTVNRTGKAEQTWFTFSYSPVRDEDGLVRGMFCAVKETTEQVLAEKHRAAELIRLQNLFQQAPNMIAILRGPNHIFDIANDAYMQHIGHREIIGKPLREALPELAGQGFFELLDQAYATGKPCFGNELPVMLQRQAGNGLEERFVNFIYQPTFDYRGSVTGIFVEGSDVTESVKTYRALQQSEDELRAANRRKDEFLAMLAHELRNPLAPISTAASLLRISSSNEAVVQKSSEVIKRQVDHMTELVDDLLDVSRVTRGLITLQEEVLNVESLLDGAIEQVRPLINARHHNLVVHWPQTQLLIKGDRTRMVQVFANILNNAAKYTPENGHLEISVADNREHVEVSFQDNGLGISQSLLPHVFNLFTQAERSPDRAQGGLGLGLSLVKSLVELHGGEVWAISDGPGKGSRFTVRLPRALAATDHQTLDNEEVRILGSKTTRKVLVVDDNKDAAETLQLLLEAAGHQVLVAYTAHEALALVSNSTPAVLFLDIGLPDMDGYALARRLRALPALNSSTLVALTGYGQLEARQHAKDAGFDHFLVKPVMLPDMLEVLEEQSSREYGSVLADKS